MGPSQCKKRTFCTLVLCWFYAMFSFIFWCKICCKKQSAFSTLLYQIYALPHNGLSMGYRYVASYRKNPPVRPVTPGIVTMLPAAKISFRVGISPYPSALPVHPLLNP